MTITFALDPRTNDLVIGRNGHLLITTGAEQVAQRIRIALRHYLYEYFLDVPKGVPYDQLILGGKYPKLTASLLRQQVLTVPGVRALAKQDIDYNNRHLDYYARVEVDGEAGPEIIEIIISLN